MFKLPIAAAIGLTAAISAAHADPILLPAPLHIPPPSLSAPGLSTYDSPSFDRFVDMCARMGFDCSAPAAGRPSSHFGPHAPSSFALSEAAQADAEKRMALYAQEWEEFADDFAGHVEIHPARPQVTPFGFFSYNAPRVSPYPNIELYQFGHRLPSVPRIQVPHGYSFPRGAFSHGSIRNNPVFPWPSL